METEPHRRYPSMGAVADELRRFLDGEPIHARPSGKTERAWRWCRRNPIPAVLSGAVVLAVILGFAAVTAQWRVAVRHAREAERQEEQAQENFLLALAAVDDYFTAISEEILLNEPGMHPLRDKLLEQALRYYSRFIEERRGDRDLERQLAAAWYRRGRIAILIGTREDAASAFEHAIGHYERLLERQPDDPDLREELARCLNNMGLIARARGDEGASEQAYHRAITLQQALLQDFPDSDHYQTLLARMLNNRGVLMADTQRYEEALIDYQAALDIHDAMVERHPDNLDMMVYRAKTCLNVGDLHYDRRRLDEARDWFARAHLLNEELVERAPQRAAFRAEVGTTALALASVERRLGNNDVAMDWARQSIEILKPFVQNNTALIIYQRTLANAYYVTGRIHSARGEDAAAIAAVERAIEGLSRLVENDPTDGTSRNRLSIYYEHLGYLTTLAGRMDDALPHMRMAVEVARGLVALEPEAAKNRYTLAGRLSNLAVLLQRMERWDESRDRFLDAVAELDVIIDHPGRLPYFVRQGEVFLKLASTMLQAGRTEEALSAFDQAENVFLRAAERFPDSDEPHEHLLQVAYSRAVTLHGHGRHAEAVDAWSIAVDRAERLQREAELAVFPVRLAECLIGCGRTVEGVECLERHLADQPPSGEMAVLATRVLASAAEWAPSDEQQASWASRCIDLLEQAHGLGFFEEADRWNAILEDDAYRTVRERPDFSALAAAVAAGSGP